MMNYYRNVLYNDTMGIWDNMKNAASATHTAATNASSKAMSAARQAHASVTDPTSSERAKNAAICTKASDHICNDMGKIPAPGDDMYTVKNMTVNGQVLHIRIKTSAGNRRGMEYMEQNKQAIRNALISKGIKPAVSNLPAMEQYNKDMKLYGETYDEIRKAENQGNVQHPTTAPEQTPEQPTAPEQSAGRRPRRRTRRHSRKTRGKTHRKRSRGAKSRGKRKGSRKRK
jgi:soluble cytochrome b562